MRKECKHITVQSMTNTKTADVARTAEQINTLADLGCDIIRVAVPDMDSAAAIAEIKKLIGIPLVADIHFDYKLAIRAAEAGADCLRINPGNIGDIGNTRAVADIANEKNIPIRIGVNSGSAGSAKPQKLADLALEYTEMLEGFGFYNIWLSAKTTSVPDTVAVYRMLHKQTDYPLHLGVTEAGTERMGLIKSSIAIGALLAEGIGDTIRVSLTAPPEKEVLAGIAILKALGLRGGYELVSCPTCGRCGIDLIPIAEEVDKRLMTLNKDITVAVMGCAVNGPGEARRADYGIAGGDGEGVLFRRGVIQKKVPMSELIDELFAVIEGDTSSAACAIL